MMAKLTVLMPVYNGERFLKEAIDSILNQTFGDYEFLIIDDKSQDSSKEIILSFKDKRIRFIQNRENLGQTETLNIGVNISSARYIARIDQDDKSLPGRFAKEIEMLDKFSQIGIIFSDSFIIDEEGRRRERTLFDYARPSRSAVFVNLLKRNFITGNTAMIRKSVFAGIGLYDPRYQIAAEYDFFLRLAHKYKVDFINEPLAEYRVHGNNSSANTEKTIKEVIQMLKNFQQYNLLEQEQKRVITKIISWHLATLGMHYLFQDYNRELSKSMAIESLRTNLLSPKAFATIAIGSCFPKVFIDHLMSFRRRWMQ